VATFDSGSFSTQHFAGTSWDLGQGSAVEQGSASLTATADVSGYLNQQHLIYLTPLRCTAKIKTPYEPSIKGGATWKHLWSPIRAAETPEEKVKHTTSVRVILPETHQLIRIPADTLPERIVRHSRIGVETPTLGAMVPAVSVRGTHKARYRRPKAHAQTAFVRAVSESRVNVIPPVPEVVVMPVSIRAKSYYGYYTPEAVQNLTEEMVMWL
jgi:hypothetical protein